MFDLVSVAVAACGVGTDAFGRGVDVGTGVSVGVTRVGIAVGDGVKMGINVGVDVGEIGFAVFDGVAGNTDGVRLDVGIAVGTSGFGPGVAVHVVVDVGDAVSTPGAVTVFEKVHAVKVNTTIRQQRCKFSMKRLIPFILRSYLFLSRSNLTNKVECCNKQILMQKQLPFVRYFGHITFTIEANVLGITVNEQGPGFGINNLIIELYLATAHAGYPTANSHPLIITSWLVIT